MVDEVIYEEGDILTERNLGIVIGQPNIADYRIRGCDVDFDPNNNNIDIASDDPDADAAVATDTNDRGYILLPDRRLDVDLATTTATNYVYLVHDPTAAGDDSISVLVQDSKQAPSGASVLVAEVDPVADEVTQPPVGGPDVIADDLTVLGATTINGDSLTETVQDIVAAFSAGGDKISVSYDDAADALTIDTTALDQQEVYDAADALLSAGDKISLAYDAGADDLQIDTSALDQEEVEDTVAALLVGGDKLSLSYDDGASALTLDTTALDAEEVQDEVDTLLTGGTGIDLTYDDANSTLTVDAVREQVEDWIAMLVGGGDKVSVTHDDGADTITIDTTALDAEEVRDEVGSLLVGGDGISITVDDPGDSVTVALPTDAVGLDELDQSVSPTWTSKHNFSGGIGGLPKPAADNDAARKQYVDAMEQGLDPKDSVVAATDGTAVDLTSSTDPNPIDGVTLSDGDRVLLKDQTDATENGIYSAVTATDPTTWTRTEDFDDDADVTDNAYTFVERGSANVNEGWAVITNDPITVGSTNIVWSQFSGAGQITAGDGLSKTGDTLAAVVSDYAGTGLTDDGSNNLDVQQEQIEDWVAALATGGTNITTTYDDANDQLVIDTSALNQEEVEDTVSSLLSASSNLAWNYDDSSDVLTVSLSGPITGVQIGTSDNRQDGYFNTVDSTAVDTERVGDARHYAEAYSGSDPDARLDNALAAATDGDTIILESDKYNDTRTISKDIGVISPGNRWIANADISANWELTGQIYFDGGYLNGSTLTISNNRQIVTNVSVGSIQVNDSDSLFYGLSEIDITFASGTSSNVVDASTKSTATDNGSNTVGIIR